MVRGDGPLDVDVSNPNPNIDIQTWQVINTTTWQMSDTLTLKNIVSYGEYVEDAAFSLYSDNFTFPGTTRPYQYITLDTQPGYHAAAGSTTTEELQLQGRSADGKFNFVVGGYLEFSRPLGWNQQRTGIYGNCTDPGTLQCVGGLPLIPLPANALFPGSPATTLNGAIVSESRTKINFDNHGIFAQGTYNFTDQFAITLGGRWTFDKIDGYAESNRYTFGTLPAAFGGSTILFARSCNDSLNHPTVNLITNGGDTTACGTRIKAKTNKPTWLIDLDFKPTPDTLLYAKWSRGYRQGAVNFTNPGLETVGPEKVEAYEVGAKLTFRGGVPGYFNIAAFYNDFSDQQIFGALIAKPNSGLSGGAALINAGKSIIKGIEIDSGVTLFQMLRLGANYAYLDTELKDLITPTLAPDSPFERIIPRGVEGGPLTYAPKHKASLTADLNVPLGNAGELALGAIFTYTSSQSVDGNRTIPSYSLLNLNAAINDVAGTGFDVMLFAQNVTNKKFKTSSGGGYESSGILDFMYGPPRMYGVRLKYAFGR
jgi:iron complex outermembrane receptor protein